MQAYVPMTRDVIYVTPDDSLSDAYDLMRDNDFRHLPVVEGGKLVGVLSDRDVLLRSQYTDGRLDVPSLAVADAMTRDVIACRPSSLVSDVAAIMIDRKIDCLPVTDATGELMGLVTSSDLLELLRGGNVEAGYREIPFNFKIRRYGDVATQVAGSTPS